MKKKYINLLQNRVFYVQYKAEYKYINKKPTKLKRLGAFIKTCTISQHKILKYPYLRYFDFKRKDFRKASKKFKIIDANTNKILLKVG